MKTKITYEQEKECQMRKEAAAIFNALTYEQRERVLHLMRQMVNGRKETA